MESHCGWHASHFFLDDKKCIPENVLVPIFPFSWFWGRCDSLGKILQHLQHTENACRPYQVVLFTTVNSYSLPPIWGRHWYCCCWRPIYGIFINSQKAKYRCYWCIYRCGKCVLLTLRPVKHPVFRLVYDLQTHFCVHFSGYWYSLLPSTPPWVITRGIILVTDKVTPNWTLENVTSLTHTFYTSRCGVPCAYI